MPPRRLRRWTLSLVVMSLAAGACAGPEPLEATRREMLEFESLTFPGRLWDPFMPPVSQGGVVNITGSLTVPPTDHRLPAVVITHGCGGISSGETGWVRDLTAAGMATLLVDSFGGRGITEICSGTRSVNIAGMLVDAYRGADAIRDHPYVDGRRIALLGLSFGGRTALWSAMERFQERYGGEPFAAYAAFYPASCYIRLQEESRLRGGPIRIFHGTADDWLPIDQCRDYVDRLQAAGVDVELFEYEGARHAFDNLSLLPNESLPVASTPGECSFVEQDGQIMDSQTGKVATTDAACVRRGVTIGFDREARAEALIDLTGFLAGVFAGEDG